ncbi:E3 ubiquitin-protein ligase TRIP12 isoform X2 [Harmonia axyridis]|uniref:E3 ubiquitin-protein ligase TRIP12 isoform X2 n=1 Tax=Harmonia axyridis TaxID=115357 RepID=UPI001E275933|nr:E3 ubiquitin-protein ligase TRIP12 isoform X2 [Harmonia axyridis]
MWYIAEMQYFVGAQYPKKHQKTKQADQTEPEQASAASSSQSDFPSTSTGKEKRQGGRNSNRSNSQHKQRGGNQSAEVGVAEYRRSTRHQQNSTSLKANQVGNQNNDTSVAGPSRVENPAPNQGKKPWKRYHRSVSPTTAAGSPRTDEQEVAADQTSGRSKAGHKRPKYHRKQHNPRHNPPPSSSSSTSWSAVVVAAAVAASSSSEVEASEQQQQSKASSHGQRGSTDVGPPTRVQPKRSQGSAGQQQQQQPKAKEPSALGASSSSQSASREEPPRLTRSGPVLRRSTRNYKGHPSTTGSCASSSGASGSGGSSRRAARQQKVGTSTSGQVTAPTLHAAAAMATEQPDVPTNSAIPGEEPPSPQDGPQAISAGSGPSGLGLGLDSESDENEVGRLQALLEARGLPPHLFGALGPRMQHILHRSMSSNSSVAKAQALLPGLQALGDEGQQLQAVIEMCQILVMGNEEILTGFPVKHVVPALITLLGMEHNFDIMNHACRALTYMMEALPRSSAVVVDAVPVFLEKLQVIQCMDVAEQSLTALDMLSRRHSKAILQARGVSACLMYLDFFSISAQRNALSITANCCQNLSNDEFQYVQESLSLLASRLSQQDKKCVESVCLAFSRLVDSFQMEPTKLQEIASAELLTNLQQLLVVTPPIISTGTFITVLRMLSVMCANCPDLALTLLKQNIAETLVYLLTGSVEFNHDDIELIPRQPQEQFEITALIGELMPKLPTDGLFAVDALLEKSSTQVKDQFVWQWRDDRGLWRPYGAVDSRIIEAAHINGDDEVSLNTLGRIYTIDFHSMSQINEDTGTTRPVQRRFTPANIQATPPSDPQPVNHRPASASRDARVACLREERGLAAAFIRSLFSVLYEVYSSSAGPAVRCKCLKALLRMVFYASADLLRDVLKNQVVSSHIAGMMASSDLRIVVGALQMAEILMTKLPDEFGVHFRREGVIYQINRLTDPEVPLGISPPKVCSSSSSFSPNLLDSQPGPSQTPSGLSLNGSSSSSPLVATPISSNHYAAADSQKSSDLEAQAQSPSHSMRLTDVLKRKRVKRGLPSRAKTKQEETPLPTNLVQDIFSKNAVSGGAPTTASATTTPSNSSRPPRYTGSATRNSFLQSLNPARWGRSVNSVHERNFSKDSTNLSKSVSNSNITAGNKEKTRSWIRDQANKFIDTYSGNEEDQHPATNVLARLRHAIEKLPTIKCREALEEFRDILIESDISPFEVNYSGLIRSLLGYIADPYGPIDREQRLRVLLNVFANCPLDGAAAEPGEFNPAWMGALVAKLNGCVSQLEQFPVKVHDLPASTGNGRGGTSALKFFNTHQLKCNLQRHPDCTNLKQWKGGTVKIDPLALVQAIERYLVVRGYGRLRDKDSGDSDDADSDDDIDDTLAAVVISQTGARHKLQFLIGNNVLPYNMTVYQAVRQFSNNGNDQSETDTDNETPLGNAAIWVQTHVIYYRPLKEDQPAGRTGGATGASGTVHTSRKGKGASNKSVSRRKVDDFWNEGIAPAIQSPLTPYLRTQLPETVTIQDASLEVLCLLRILHGLNTYWNSLYPMLEYRPILPPSDFLNSKIAAKASRQLQDPLVIMTGNLPNWLQQIATVCPFLFPFETRQLLFYATSFDRDRALQRLLDMSPELSSTDSQERVTPRLDRRKRTIAREDVLKQAEQVMQDMASSKALLEIQYENEVGTGLGPTLEFYALVSKELQRTNLELWNAPGTDEKEYVHNQDGLFPAPIAKSAKVGQVTKLKTKFRFMGKFMAKAVMDSRMLDLPFSVSFYRWLLGQEHSLSLSDLKCVAPEVHRTLQKMQLLVRQRDIIMENKNLSHEEIEVEIEKITFDGCPIADLGLDFVLPGHNIELMKNGKNIHLTIHNLHQYVNLVTHWTLIEGVSRQMESLREGFETVFPLQNLRLFFPDELESVFCGSPKDTLSGWDAKTLMECCRPDHGYNADSKAIRFLFEVLSSYDREEQRRFVQFLTGSPRLPVGGFKSLSPPLTVVRKTLEPNMNPDDYLPSVMTCVNYLKLPDYSSIEVMREKLKLAASEGQHSFHLS